jgi:hypothetical protein
MENDSDAVQMEWQGGGGLDSSVIILKEVGNPKSCASGY